MLQLVGTASAMQIEMSVLTCHPGRQIFELEGHSGLRVIITDSVNPRLNQDLVFDWGNFDFDSPNFVYRFVKGETDYSIGVRPTSRFVRYYGANGRKVFEQKLSLTDHEKLRIMSLLDENMLPQNQVYRYNYVKDNCATRIVEIIEKGIADTLSLSPSMLPASTFREAMRHYHANYPWYQFGIDLCLGSPLDTRLPDRAMIYSPEALQRMLQDATRADGRNIVASTSQLTFPATDTAIDGPTPFILTPMAVALMVLVVTTVITIADLRRRKLSRWYDTLIFTIFGLMGCVIGFLIFISVHEATSPNWLFLWLNPACFIVSVAVWVKKAKKLLFCYQIINFVLLLALTGIFLAGIQSPDAAFYPLVAADAMRSLLYIYLYKCHSNARQT